MPDSDTDDERTGAGDMNLGLEVAKGFVAKMIQAVRGFVGAILFARILGPASFGGFYLLLSLVQLSDRPVQGIGTQRRNASRRREPADRRFSAHS